MAGKEKDLKNQLAEKANGNGNGTAVAERKGSDTFETLMLKYEDQFRMALPRAVGFDRFMRAALSTIRGSNQLKQCDAVSVLGSLLTAAQVGLEVGPLGLAYLVPFNDRKSGKKLAQIIFGYRGLLQLARNSGEIKSIMVEPAHEGDEFHYELGLEPVIKHIPALKDRGDRILYYGVAHFNNGGYQLRVMTMEEVYQHRARSASWKSKPKDSPWTTDEDAMCRKTVLRAMWSWLPMAVETMQATASDETYRLSPSEDAEYMTVDGEASVRDDSEGDEPQEDGPPPGSDDEGQLDLTPDPRGF